MADVSDEQRIGFGCVQSAVGPSPIKGAVEVIEPLQAL